MKVTCRFAFLFLMVLSVSSSAAPSSWEGAVANVLHFFRTHAWDEATGSYLSEIDERGNARSDAREIVPLARIIYADVNGPVALRDPRRARQAADFLVRHLLARDGIGLWFRSAVNGQGQPQGDRPFTYIFEQAYGISGLTALYASDPAANADLLPLLREAARSFWARFHDDEHGGLFYYYNFRDRSHANDQGQTHKSYQSTVYPISSFLLDLREADAANRATYDRWINELLTVAVDRIVEKRDGRPTGWLLERMAPDFAPDATYVMSEAGHATQLAWVLGEAVERGIVIDPARRALYRETARDLLAKLLQHGVLSPTGAVYDAFDRTTGRPLRDANGRATSAWWSNLEALIAYDFALRHGWLSDPAPLATLRAAYFGRFVDSVHGGEFFRIDAETGEVVDPTKGNGGKSAYHCVEAYRYLSRR